MTGYTPDQNKPDGEYNTKFQGREAVEKVETVESEKDGVLETKYSVDWKQAHRYKFSAGGSKNYAKRHDAIDWSE